MLNPAAADSARRAPLLNIPRGNTRWPFLTRYPSLPNVTRARPRGITNQGCSRVIGPFRLPVTSAVTLRAWRDPQEAIFRQLSRDVVSQSQETLYETIGKRCLAYTVVRISVNLG